MPMAALHHHSSFSIWLKASQLKNNIYNQEIHWIKLMTLNPPWPTLVLPRQALRHRWLTLTALKVIKITRLLAGIGSAGVKTTERQIESESDSAGATKHLMGDNVRAETAAAANRSALSSAETSHYGSAWGWAPPRAGRVGWGSGEWVGEGHQDWVVEGQ